MTDNTFEGTKKRIMEFYRAQKRLLLRKELTLHEMPTTEMRDEVYELRGCLRGLKKAIGIIEVDANSPEFELVGELRL